MLRSAIHWLLDRSFVHVSILARLMNRGVSFGKNLRGFCPLRTCVAFDYVCLCKMKSCVKYFSLRTRQRILLIIWVGWSTIYMTFFLRVCRTTIANPSTKLVKDTRHIETLLIWSNDKFVLHGSVSKQVYQNMHYFIILL